MTTPKGGNTFGKMVPRQENNSLNTLGWSRTIMSGNQLKFFMIFCAGRVFVNMLRCLKCRLDELMFSKGKTAFGSNNTMINQADINQLASLLDALGQL